jgi:HlyD family secretion protein
MRVNSLPALPLLEILIACMMLAACNGGNGEGVFQGYVEGEFIEVAPEVTGRIVELSVREGDVVAAGAPLFSLYDNEAESAVAQAKAELERAEAQLRNLQQGQRPPEIAVIEAQISEAEAELETARKEYERQLALFEKRVISEARLDQAREAVSVAEARVDSAERQRDVAEMPARTPEIEAGERAVEAARAALDMAKTRLEKHAVAAPAGGRIEDVHYRPGEVAAASAPVLSLLPDGRLKVIFFVPQAARSSIAIGAEMSIACDGCPAGLTAPVTWLGSEAEYTPPVIFSRETRGKLVFRAEASLSGEAANLPLGQPVDVFPALRGAQ